jgi:hypothetical protein
MKKLKFMLLSFALLAIVGGALAFKAKFQTLYCTTPSNPDGTEGFCTISSGVLSFCDLPVTGKIQSGTQVAFGCYTTAQDLDGDSDVECTEVNQTPKRCLTTPSAINQD